MKICSSYYALIGQAMVCAKQTPVMSVDSADQI